MSNRSKYYLTLSLIGFALMLASYFVIDKRKAFSLRIRVQPVAYSQAIPR